MIAFKPPLIVQRAEDDKTQSSAEFLAHCCPLAKQITNLAGHAQAGHTKSSAEYLVCFPVEAQEGHARADQTPAGYSQPEYYRLAGLDRLNC